MKTLEDRIDEFLDPFEMGEGDFKTEDLAKFIRHEIAAALDRSVIEEWRPHSEHDEGRNEARLEQLKKVEEIKGEV